MHFILLVHHDADLYGADQSLLRTVRAMKASPFTPIVTLPHQGPLVALLLAEGAEVHIGPVGKLTRQLMRPAALHRLLADLWRSVRFMGRVVAGRPISLVYTNSVAALGGALWAALHRKPKLWHVREIVVAPKLAAVGFPTVLQLLGGWCVCNSNATRQWIVGTRPALAQRSSVIWNGLEATTPIRPGAAAAFRAKMGLQPGDIVATLVGRINRWKGQGVLIEAARLLKAQGHRQLKFLIVGDVADGQNHFRQDMLAQIDGAGVQDSVLWHPFTPDVNTVWAASDIAVAPSIDPEPFGRVAIEAMAQQLPVVAAAHGGLAEIVLDDVTGILVQPGSAPALAAAIARLADAPTLRAQMGQAGRQRQQQCFSQAEHDQKLMALLTTLAAQGTPTQAAAAKP
ncbi:MAG: glycosyltransferase family 4 protein [Rhodoferax sp.]|nr:glycosyltransferase family 4 protein [Rhodoferax sp.]